MAAQRKQGGSRAVALLNISVVAIVVAVVAAVALVVSPPAPPGIAEFAPEASKAIVKAPLAQSAVTGAGASGACAAGQSCSGTAKKTPPPTASAKPSAKPTVSAAAAATTAPAASASAAPSAAPTTKAPKPTPTVPATLAPVGVPSSLQCYQWPDGSVTQTGDPQSPPCVATWNVAAGNGGATSTGVTGSEIDVVVPFGEFYSGTAVPDMVSYFNSHYEFYGRSIKLVDYEPDFATQADPSAQHSDAQAVVSMQPFATTQLDTSGYDTDYIDTVTGSHVVYVADTPGVTTAATQQADAPYSFSYAPPVDVAERQEAAYYCADLAGHNAVYAGGNLTTKPRKVAILYPDGTQEPAASYTALVDGLSSCGVTADPMEYPGSVEDSGGSQQQGDQLMLKLSQAGYTTLILNDGEPSSSQGLEMDASTVGYTPEWLVTGLGGTYSATDGGATEENHVFGMATSNKILPDSQEPFYQAITAEDPSFSFGASAAAAFPPYYRQLLLIAAGIQLAGPHLTPATFQQGLQAAEFPNPEAAAAPSYQATVGFASGHSMVQDEGLWWQSASQTNAQTGVANPNGGGLCWVDLGKRFTLTTWPGNLTPFSGACR